MCLVLHSVDNIGFLSATHIIPNVANCSGTFFMNGRHTTILGGLSQIVQRRVGFKDTNVVNAEVIVNTAKRLLISKLKSEHLRVDSGLEIRESSNARSYKT
jgi:hypothetical protein